MSSWFGFGTKPSVETEEAQTTRALPAAWYRSPGLFELERRAIFSKKWLLVTHKLRFSQTGDYIQVTEAGYTFFIIKDRQGEIRAFHNVCRHRAYPLVSKDEGKVTNLVCKYHGWSYGFDGKLAKAPKYQEIPSFNREENGLYTVHVHVDHLGFVWVNLDSNDTPAVKWEEDFAGVDQQPRHENYDMKSYHFDHQWEMIGEYNWKTLADNYNEVGAGPTITYFTTSQFLQVVLAVMKLNKMQCYHCPTGHPALPAVSDLEKYSVETSGGHIQHFPVRWPGTPGPGSFSTYLYPNASATLSPVLFFIQRCIPISPTQTKMQYEVYRQNEATKSEFTSISDFFKQVMREDKALCTEAQKNLNAGVFLNGELHPRVEKGPLYFQKLTRDLVRKHLEEEEATGKEIWPSVPKHMITTQVQEDLDLCNRLDCASKIRQDEELAW